MFDGLGLIAKPDFLQQMVASLEAGDIMIDKDWVRELDQTIEVARDEFMGSLQSIVAMTNQVPLLELGQLTSPGESAFKFLS